MKRDVQCAVIVCANLCYALASLNRIPRDVSDFDLNEFNSMVFPKDNSTKAAKRSQSKEFWLLREQNSTEYSTPGSVSETEMAPVEVLENRRPVTFEMDWAKEYEMNEVLFMSRNNCNLELIINEWEDKKLKIQYETVKTENSGQCWITLTGKSEMHLAVLISNIQLNSKTLRASSAEILSIVIMNNHFNYTLKEYHGNEDYYPLILTESDRVYIGLQFDGPAQLERSSYNLEVFNYNKRKNQIVMAMDENQHGYGENPSQNISNIFITTSEP